MRRAAALALSWAAFAQAQPQAPDEVLSVQRETQAAAASSQRTVERLDDEARTLAERYRTLAAEIEQLRQDNAELQRAAAAREERLQDLARQRGDLERLRLDLLPRLRRMVGALDQVVGRDLPFLTEERRLRVADLQQLLAQTDRAPPELLRRVLQAYLVEVGYGYEVSVERGRLPAGERSATVDFLRVGRLALYYLGLDGARGGIWDVELGRWRELPEEDLDQLRLAVKIVRQETAPQLVRLPLPGVPR